MNDRSGPIIVPSAELVAVVRHDVVPASPPDELTPYVRPVERDGVAVDWLLTDDTLAFANVTVPLQFAGWRTSWERSWLLDPLSSLERLVAAAQEFEVSAPFTTLLERVLDPGTTGPTGDVVHAMLEPGEAARLAAVFESLRDAIADRGRRGWGFVDATPGRQRIGLARAWSGQTGPETLVADRNVSVSIDATTGVTVVVVDDTGVVVDRADGVTEVEIRGDHVDIRSPGGTVSLDLHAGRVLSWLMPGCTLWRVRPVPEVVVWARTFAGIQECADYATALDSPMLLTSLRLSESEGDPRRPASLEPRRLESSFDKEQ